MVVWNLFPVAWIVARMGPRFAPLGEPLLIFCNFAAKVSPSVRGGLRGKHVCERQGLWRRMMCGGCVEPWPSGPGA